MPATTKNGHSKRKIKVQKRVSDFPAHAVVKIDGRWGVICNYFGHGHARQRGMRIVDFWEGGLEEVANDTLVEDCSVNCD